MVNTHSSLMSREYQSVFGRELPTMLEMSGKYWNEHRCGKGLILVYYNLCIHSYLNAFFHTTKKLKYC